MGTGAAQDDVGSWHSVVVTQVDTARVDLSAFVQARIHDRNTELRQLYLSQLLAIDAHDSLGLGINYTYLPTRSAAEDRYLYQHRIELEAIPRWRAGTQLRLDVRNRLEIRWLEGRRGTNERSRHRVQGRYLLPGGRRVASLFANNEFFFDWDRSAYGENRLTPFGLTFGAHDRMSLDLYYMVQSVETLGRWTHTHLAGTHLALTW